MSIEIKKKLPVGLSPDFPDPDSLIPNFLDSMTVSRGARADNPDEWISSKCLLITSRSEMPPKLLPLIISQALGVALEQKELDQEPGAGRWIFNRTALKDWNFV